MEGITWFAVIWSLWLQRNSLLFRGGSMDMEQVWEMVKVRSWAWLHSKTKNFHYSMFDWWEQWMLCIKDYKGFL
ncbi:hypothetical protein AAZX31_17G084200 [Glycine max]|uniref:Uncharacterized protein n=2 Tax=Glycine subgen. Soja TaxID=1462606 RepID=K7MKN2_SOYBN|nr:hypothetical protein JHK86_046859 [Glycine max]KHN18429.1 hypothetical protein glysoja_006842 [Glycine soja]KAG4942779.1 hypothetical protein JHK85_047425 [Glycine max]KAG5097113.1 hypothetical protein JHK82_046967 [Glycine max]KAG5101900.1 hypothetical protein JHK84_046869 [Glycine max]